MYSQLKLKFADYSKSLLFSKRNNISRKFYWERIFIDLTFLRIENSNHPFSRVKKVFGVLPGHRVLNSLMYKTCFFCNGTNNFRTFIYSFIHSFATKVAEFLITFLTAEKFGCRYHYLQLKSESKYRSASFGGGS